MILILAYLLQFFGVDPLQAGNAVQLLIVLGLTLGWISTYVFRVSNKEMTYAKQLQDYESKVLEVCDHHVTLTLRDSVCIKYICNNVALFLIFGIWQKRLESLTEAEIQVLLEQVEEEKRLLEKEWAGVTECYCDMYKEKLWANLPTKCNLISKLR